MKSLESLGFMLLGVIGIVISIYCQNDILCTLAVGAFILGELNEHI